jgi:hypothetical protein
VGKRTDLIFLAASLKLCGLESLYVDEGERLGSLANKKRPFSRSHLTTSMRRRKKDTPTTLDRGHQAISHLQFPGAHPAPDQ